MSYLETAATYLNDKKPDLEENPIEVASAAAKDAQEREQELFEQMSSEEPDEGKKGTLRMISREIATSEMVDFLSNL